MPSACSSALIATAYLALCARALPHPAPTYQVVDVGGPSSQAAAETVYSTVVESSTPSIVTEPAITVTATPSAAAETQSITTTQSWTVTIGSNDQPAYSHSSGSPPLPTLDSETATATATATATTTATQTETVYNTIPIAPYAAQSTSPTTTLSSFKGAFTSVGQWNHTMAEVHGPASSGTGLMYAVVPTGTTLAKRWYPATGTEGYLAGRAAPTGYVAEGWNATSSY